MQRALLHFLLTSMFLVACSESMTSPPVPPVAVSIEPGDLSSNIGSAPIVIVIGRMGPPVGPADLDAITGSIELVDPSGAAKVLSVDLQEDYFLDGSYSAQHFAAYSVEDPGLVDGWNSIRVRLFDGVVAGATWSPNRVVQDPTGTFLEARVNPSSAPIIQTIRLCPKSEGQKVQVFFSELVQYDPYPGTPDDLVRVTFDGTSCSALPLAPEPDSTGLAKFAEFICTGQTDGSAVNIQLGPGFQASTGLLVRLRPDDDQTAVTISTDSMQSHIDGCRGVSIF